MGFFYLLDVLLFWGCTFYFRRTKIMNPIPKLFWNETNKQTKNTGKTKDYGQFPKPFFILSGYSSGVPTVFWEQQGSKEQTQ